MECHSIFELILIFLLRARISLSIYFEVTIYMKGASVLNVYKLWTAEHTTRRGPSINYINSMDVALVSLHFRFGIWHSGRASWQKSNGFHLTAAQTSIHYHSNINIASFLCRLSTSSLYSARLSTAKISCERDKSRSEFFCASSNHGGAVQF